MKVALLGAGGKVGSVLAPALEAAGHELVDLEHADVLVDFTTPEAVTANVERALAAGVPCVVGTTGADLTRSARRHANEGSRSSTRRTSPSVRS